MAFFSTSAAAGVVADPAAAAASERNDNTPHYHFIHSMILPSTLKIQKELRGRRFREVQSKLGEAMTLFQTFQFQSWPPPGWEMGGEPPDADADGDGNHQRVSLGEHLAAETSKAAAQAAAAELRGAAAAEVEETATQTTAATTDDDLESTFGDFSKAPDNDDLKPFDDVEVPATAAAAAAATTRNGKGRTRVLNGVEDDPQTRQPMDESVTAALEAYVMTMQHPQKTNKACEDALECVTQLVIRNYVSGRAGGRDDGTSSGSMALRERGEGQTHAAPSRGEASLVHRLMQAIQKCSESSTESVQSHVIECLKSVMTSPKVGIHEATMLMGIRSVFHIYLVTKSVACQQSAKAALMEIVEYMMMRMEESPLKELSLWHTDSYYLMRSLVKLSSKELPGIDDTPNVTPSNFLAQQFLTSSSVDPLALNNKVLSLELILQVMECAGSEFCNSDKFIHLVQSQLCVALLKNCMSNNTQVAFSSQQAFLILVYKFKAHLKDEIQVFMSNVFLRVLDSENSSFPQKALVLESLRSLCNDPVLLAQIFLNYDCDFDAMNLYKDIVFRLTKLVGKATTQSTSNMSKKDADEHYELSLAGNEVLVTILQAFLAALGMQANNEDANDTAGKMIRKTLNIHEVSTPRRIRVSATVVPASVTICNADSGQSSVVNGEDFEEVTMASASEMKRKISGHNITAATTTANGTGDSAAASAGGAKQSSSDVAGKIVDAFDRKRNAEQNFELGAVKFTLNLKTGLNFFFDNGFVECDAKAIALFFLAHKDKLDKTQMGEVLGREPDAAFIKKPTDLDPEKGGKGFFIRILFHYIDAMDFTGIMFDDAIRLFLSGFRLPGEAQKIDRIMEKFAERFTLQNPDVFPSADTAFILAFSVIMLNTDLHNPSIKPERRMTVDSFVRNNRGIGENGSDLPEAFLSGIFARIKQSPFSLKEDDAAREKASETNIDVSIFGDNGGLLGGGIFGTSADDRKKEKFKKEREEMMAATEQLIRRKKGKAASKSISVTDSVDPADVVKPMFDVTWGPMIGILSQVLECSNDERSIAVCLNGFVYAIRISAHSNMSLARDTFVNSLAKMTYLGSIKEMKYKNIESIRTLMNIAITDGEYLGESWGPVLQCISQLSRMRMSASGLKSDEAFLQDGSSTKDIKKKDVSSKSYFARETKAEATRETEDVNSRAILESISEQLIDQVFSCSVKLSAQSLAHFIEQLVAVSISEIEGDLKSGITGVSSTMTDSAHGGGDDGPSIFSLHRLVEVADYNMDVRPRLVWTKIWEIMADFFSNVGCHRNAMVSVFAIDSLKQLGLKFLEKPELSEFNFQRLFLKPFLLIWENPKTRQDIRELILACVDQMIHKRADNLQSGWKIFFDILAVAANSKDDKISLRALSILQETLDKHLEQLAVLAPKMDGDETKDDASGHYKRHRNANAEDFLGMCRTSLCFINFKEADSPHPIGISMRALCHVAIYADLIAAGRILPPISGVQFTDPAAPGYTYDGLSEEEALKMVLWRTLIEGLADGVRAPELSREGGLGNLVQRGSVLALRAILLRHGSKFTDDQLKVMLEQTIIPSFQEAVENDSSPVTSIASESPANSSLDFVADPLPIPPPNTDAGLLKFEEVFRQGDRAPTRAMGPAELLIEATFTELRNGGRGDLTQTYKFAKKELDSSEHSEQPFPDSWISTTAPVALGTLTDIASEIMMVRGASGAAVWYCTIGEAYKRWCNGDTYRWMPCEAVARIACSEVSRFLRRVTLGLLALDKKDATVWANQISQFFTEILNRSLEIEQQVSERLLREKWKAFNDSSSNLNSDDVEGGIDVVKIDFGENHIPVTNFSEIPIEVVSKLDIKLDTPNVPAWMKFLPALKIRCVAAHYLQQALLSLREEQLIPFIDQYTISILLKSLNLSREFAEDAVKKEDLAHAFQEAMFSEWGLDDDVGEEALVNIARLNNTQGSAMFFLTQTAGATNAIIRLLNALYDYEEVSGEETWDRRTFAGEYLLQIMEDIFFKFAESEAKEGHRIDPNVWRNTAESGVKVAMYCTSFASVVVGLLKAMLSFDPEHIECHKAVFFPMVCELVSVQSDEIRKLVRRILVEKFSPLLGIGQDPARRHHKHDKKVRELEEPAVLMEFLDNVDEAGAGFAHQLTEDPEFAEELEAVERNLAASYPHEGAPMEEESKEGKEEVEESKGMLAPPVD